MMGKAPWKGRSPRPDPARLIPNREHGTTPENSITPRYTSSLIKA